MRETDFWQGFKTLAEKGKRSSIWQDFKSFAFKGNLIDLAVAVVIGAATTTVIKSMVENIIMPLLSYVVPAEGEYWKWQLGKLKVGAFLSDLVTFLAMALAAFLLIVRLMGVIKRAALAPATGEPDTKECPLCLSVIPFRAKKCAHCTADLPG